MPSQSVDILDPSKPLVLGSDDFARNKYEIYPALLEGPAVRDAQVSILKLKVVPYYEHCRFVLSDPRFVRNKGRANGKPTSGPLPIPLPRSVAALTKSMIYEDDPEHRRHRTLVNKAFTSRAVNAMQPSLESLTDELLDQLAQDGDGGASVDLLAGYARRVPTRVIGEMMGLSNNEAAGFNRSLGVVTEGFSGLRVIRTLLWDLRKTATFVREVIVRKQSQPGDDILTALIQAEEEGQRLSEDELVAMVFLLMIAGFETTMHLIGNGVRTLIENPEARLQLAKEPELWESAVDEIVRYRGPVHGTKPMYATEDVAIDGLTIPRGAGVMPLLGAANQDPRAFDEPHRFDITRTPNHHLGFSFGAHFCLGKQLALMETRIALKGLFDRFPDLGLTCPPDALEVVNLPGWHRHASMPIRLKP